MSNTSLIKWFNELSMQHLNLVGGKNASLGEMISNLSSLNIKVPLGFAITTNAYKNFLQENKLTNTIFNELKKLDSNNLASLNEVSQKIQEQILAKNFNSNTLELIKKAYLELKNNQKNFRVAVRSSASAEDLPNASFAGQQDTYLHVSSFEELIEKTKAVYASMFSPRAISYRIHNNFNHQDVYMSVGVQEMVHSDQGASGVMFSLDPETGFKDVIFINASYGLGESVVQGIVNPDEFVVYKPAIKNNELIVLQKRLGSKAKKLVFDPTNSKLLLKEEDVEKELQNKFCLNKEDLSILAKAGLSIEEHYKKPMDIEWAKDGISGKIFILQARPETIHGQKKNNTTSQSYALEQKSKVLCEGRAVGKKIAQGKARVLKSIQDAHDFMPGEVLVTDMTDPNWEPIMQKASAIVTNRGGRTCHAAIIARELGLAAIVGCGDATKKITNLSDITVSCGEGDVGQVFEGLLPITIQSQSIALNKNIGTDLMLIAANPSKAFSYHSLPHKGIGLARLEFIIANSIGIHPCAILQIDNMPKEIKEEILHKSKNFASAKDFYIDTIASGIACLAAAAKPYKAIVRLSDFKTNEYEELLGGHLFEPKENNPMIGFRGAARYISDLFKDAFKLECMALKKVYDQYKMDNVEIMIPFCRTLQEAKEVRALLDEQGLSAKNNIKVIMMCEIPSNIMLADEFLDYFDGFSIGSNDLTQLCLGIDRDSHLVASGFNESDKAVLKMIEIAITACKKRNKYIGICGQGPSDNLEFAKWLISKGIDSISISADTFMNTYSALSS